MTIVAGSAFVNGFEVAQSVAEVEQIWQGGPIRAATSHVTPLLGSGHALVAAVDIGQALSLPSGAGICYRTVNGWQTTQAPTICFAATRSSTTARRILTTRKVSTSTHGLYVTWKTDGKFEVFNRSSVSLGTTATAYTGLDTRYFIQIQYATGIGSSIKFYVDGTLDSTFSGDTRASGTQTSVDEVHFCSDGTSATTGSDITIDDVFLFGETAANYSTTAFGNLRVEAILPTSDSTTQLTPSTGSSNYAMVDEIPASAADYVSITPTAAASKKDAYGWPKPTSSDSTSKKIYAVAYMGLAVGGRNADASPITRYNEIVNINFVAGAGNTSVGAYKYDGGAALDYSQNWIYAAAALPQPTGSAAGDGVPTGRIIDSFNTDTCGPQIVRAKTSIQDGAIYGFVAEVCKDYFAPRGGWVMGFLSFPT